jgi:hypothetical protein
MRHFLRRFWGWIWVCLGLLRVTRVAAAKEEQGYLPVHVCVHPANVPKSVVLWTYYATDKQKIYLLSKDYATKRYPCPATPSGSRTASSPSAKPASRRPKTRPAPAECRSGGAKGRSPWWDALRGSFPGFPPWWDGDRTSPERLGDRGGKRMDDPPARSHRCGNRFHPPPDASHRGVSRVRAPRRASAPPRTACAEWRARLPTVVGSAPRRFLPDPTAVGRPASALPPDPTTIRAPRTA